MAVVNPRTSHERVNDALIAAVDAATFPQVSYACNRMITEDGQNATPVSVIAREENARWDYSPQRTKAPGGRVRVQWQWELTLVFNCHVSLDLFEQAVTDSPPVVPHDEALGISQMRVSLTRANYSHPVRQLHGGAPGTRVKYIFDVESYL